MNGCVLATVFVACTAVAAAQTSAQPSRYVRATAEATVMAKPDVARISIGVSNLATSARSAAEQNASATGKVLDAIKPLLGSGGRMQTSGYSVYPHYENKNGSTSQDGFEVRNTVDVTIADLAQIPKVLDASTAAGANNINGITFGLTDDHALRLQALGEAAKKAREEAETIASALGVHVVGLANAEAGSAESPARPVMYMAKAMPTPVESGTVEVRASVTVTLEVNP